MLPESITIGLEIRKRRMDFGLSLRNLVAKTTLTVSFLSQIERGIYHQPLIEFVTESSRIP